VTDDRPTSIERAEVSFVAIAYNEVERGPRAVRSILAQAGSTGLEVIFVDDGSVDGTAEAVQAAAAGDPRLRIVRLPANVGRGGARAAGIREARGRVIALVDADVALPPDWLCRCLAELPGHAAVSGIPVPDGDASVVAQLSGATPRVVPGGVPITGSNVLFDADVLATNGFDPRDRIGEDFRLAHRLLRAGYRLRRVPGLIVRHEEGKTYGDAIRWRFANALDASTLPRELGRFRMADVVWLGWLAAWVVSITGAVVWSPWWLLLGVVASVAPGLGHAVSRFEPRPLGPFLVACLLDVPLLVMYLVGRTAGIPRLIRGRR
jgi:glycosyltransferase involved in cell wall biosynthesis